MNQQELKKVIDVIAKVFDKDELQRILFATTGKNLDGIIRSEDMQHIVLELLADAEQQGYTSRLIQGLQEFNPSDRQWKDMLRSLPGDITTDAPPPDEPEPTTDA